MNNFVLILSISVTIATQPIHQLHLDVVDDAPYFSAECDVRLSHPVSLPMSHRSPGLKAVIGMTKSINTTADIPPFPIPLPDPNLTRLKGPNA